jgi:flagellar biosynthesis protein FlhB
MKDTAIDLQWFARAEDEGRTEEPSEIKLRKAREEGRVAKSQELCSALVMLFTVIMVIVTAPRILEESESVLRFYFSRCNEKTLLNGEFAGAFFHYFLKMLLPVALIGTVAGVAANIIQNRGFLFSLKPIEPQFSKILPNVGQYLNKTLFSFEGAFNVAKSLVKVAVIGVAAFIIIRSDLPRILELLNAAGVRLALNTIAAMAAKLLVVCAIIFLVISIPDYLVQRHQFIESMKMTKQEVKQEYKEMEGDPEVKSHLEQAQRQLIQRNMPEAVAKSDVVITNPTHFAVALLYDRDVADAPQVMARGTDEVAFRIKAIAKDHDVPVIENRPLARALYTDTAVGDIIPSAYISAIVTIYTQIDYLNKKK